MAEPQGNGPESVDTTEEMDLTLDDNQGETTEQEVEDPGADESEAQQDDDQDSAAEEDQTPQPGTPDKALQRLQQRQSATDQRIEDVMASVKELTTAIQNQGGKPTAEQAEQAEQAGDDLTELISDIEDDDLIEGAKLKAIVKKLGKASDSLEEQVAKELDRREKLSQTAQREQRDAMKTFTAQFRIDHEKIADQYDDVVDAASQKLAKYDYLDADGQAKIWANEIWPETVREFEAAAKSGSPEPTRQKPASKTPTHPTRGASTRPAGASAGVHAGEGAFFDDDGTIPDLEE